MNRRKFIRQAGLASTLAFIPSSIYSNCAPQVKGVAKEAGLQLYTLREALEKDFKGTIEKAANIGYRNLEFFNYYS